MILLKLAGAIVFLPREPGSTRCLMTEPLLFSPAAVWLAQSLTRAGVVRFFVVCHPEDHDAAAACFPAGTPLVTPGTQDAAARLSAFLTAQDGHIIVATRPILLTDAGEQALGDEFAISGTGAGLYRVDAGALSAALGEGIELDAALRQKGFSFSERRLALALGGDAQRMEDAQLAARRASADRILRSGARVIDPAAVYIDPTVTVGSGTVLLPGVILRGQTSIGQNCEIGPNTQISHCSIGDGTTVSYSQLTQSAVGRQCSIGPFSYLRPHCTVADGVKVGDFVELKNSVIGQGTKISHLTYVGDSDVGAGVNLGCGTVTVNYDGAAKFRTAIGDNAFIGCNTNLVAPVRIGEGSYTAAGSTITSDVPADSLAIARSVQVVKNHWVSKRRGKKKQG